MVHLCLRIVGQGEKAENYPDDKEIDFSGPCDVVALEVRRMGTIKEKEKEIYRKSCASGKEAQRMLLELINNASEGTIN